MGWFHWHEQQWQCSCKCDSDSWVRQEEEVVSGVLNILDGNKVDAVICVAGGWAGSNAAASGNKIFKL